MTQAERLIRSLCEERRLQLVVEERAALKGFKETHSRREVPAKIRSLFKQLIHVREQLQRIDRQIKDAGYLTHSVTASMKTFHLTDRDTRRRAITDGFASRRDQIQRLKTNVTIATLGKSASECQNVLRGLQAKLQEI